MAFHPPPPDAQYAEKLTSSFAAYFDCRYPRDNLFLQVKLIIVLRSLPLITKENVTASQIGDNRKFKIAFRQRTLIDYDQTLFHEIKFFWLPL